MDKLIEALGAPIKSFLGFITPLFQDPNFAPALSILMVATALLIGAATWATSFAGAQAAWRRTKAIDKAIGNTPDRYSAQLAFAAKFETISVEMSRPDRFTGLKRAWDEFHETIIDETEAPIRNTARPLGYFSRALTAPKNLTFWSNIAVGLGLVLTFLGVVVALSETGKALTVASVQETQKALQQLIAITAFKFTTSVAGVASSLILRFFERDITKRNDMAIHGLCDRLERGLLFVSPQALSASQLTEVKRQTAQLEKFNTDLALQIGDAIAAKFESALQPVASSLGFIQGQMADFQTQSMGAISDQLSKTMETAASGELRALGATLAMLREDLEGLSVKLQGGGAAAASQIEAAGETFAKAATDIRAAFSELASKVDGMGVKLTAEGESAAQRMTMRLDAMLSGFEASARQNATAVQAAVEALQTAGVAAAGTVQTSLGEAFAASGQAARNEIDRAASGIRDAFGDIMEKLNTMGQRVAIESDYAANRMADQIQATLSASSQSAEQSSASIRNAIAALSDAAASAAGEMQSTINDAVSVSGRAAGEEMRKAADQLGRALGGAAVEIERLRDSFTSVESALGGHADSLKASAENSRTVASAIGDAAKGMSAAAQPVLNASTALTRAADSTAAAAEKVGKAADGFTSANTSALAGIQTISQELTRTQEALRGAWESYRTQFQNVDKELSSAVQTLSKAVTDNGENVASFVKSADQAMLSVVERLQNLLDPITEYAEALDGYAKANAGKSSERA
jgi:hypothetical protein